MPCDQQNRFLYLLWQIGPVVETLAEGICIEANGRDGLPRDSALYEDSM